MSVALIGCCTSVAAEDGPCVSAGRGCDGDVHERATVNRRWGSAGGVCGGISISACLEDELLAVVYVSLCFLTAP